MTKLLGELGEEARELGIIGGAVACVPMNALQCQPKLDCDVFNRKVYSNNFLKSLVPKAERQHRRFPGRFDIDQVRAASTLGDFDDAFIAPIYGFRDKQASIPPCAMVAERLCLCACVCVCVAGEEGREARAGLV